MRIPILSLKTNSRRDPKKRIRTDAFGGYDARLRIGDGAFADMRNLTSDRFPVLTPRPKRGVYASPENAQGIAAKDSLCWIDGTDVVIGGSAFGLGLSTDPTDCPKKLISFGTYLIVLPDKKYIDTLRPYDRGDIEVHNTTERTGEIWTTVFTPCDAGGNDAIPDHVSSVPPTGTVSDGETWVDTSSSPHVLKRYSAASAVWTAVPRTYVKVSFPEISAGLRDGDGISLRLAPWAGSGKYRVPGTETCFDDPQLDALNGTHVVRKAYGASYETGWYLVIAGMLDGTVSIENKVYADREMPDFDYVVESRNRLWGCRYRGDLAPLNEIRACKPGDFRNWNVFEGLSTDSYAASCGSDGEWTGAVNCLGYPIFFKEDRMHRVSGETPSDFRILETPCPGIERGSWASAAVVDGLLYYKSRSGISVYDGSLPTGISGAFGDERYRNAVGGAHGTKYYVSMEEADGGHVLFTYDTKKGIWMKEDGTGVLGFASYGDDLYYIDRADGKIRTVYGTGTPEEAPVRWMAETGDVGLDDGARKYVTALNVRLSLGEGASVRLFLRYDGAGEWIPVCAARSMGMRAVDLPVRPRRCDHFRLRVEGEGDARIYAIEKTVEYGSRE